MNFCQYPIGKLPVIGLLLNLFDKVVIENPKLKKSLLGNKYFIMFMLKLSIF
jgi:hypothetical protein